MIYTTFKSQIVQSAMGSATSRPLDSTSTVVAVKATKSTHHELPLWAWQVLEYSDWNTRHAVSRLSKEWHQNTTTMQFYRFLCTRLSTEHGVYTPVTPPFSENWKTLFFELFKLRRLWNAPYVNLDDPTAMALNPLQSSDEFNERFKISVYAKFRPHQVKEKDNKKESHQNSNHHNHKQKLPHSKDGSNSKTIDDSKKENEENNADNDSTSGTKVTLPLHQRLAMIRMSHNIKNNRSALKVLTEEGGWFQEKWADNHNHVKESDKGSSFMAGDENSNRYQPKWKRLQDAGDHSAFSRMTSNMDQSKMIAKVHSIDPLSGRVVMITPDIGLREFSFDGVLPTNSSQKHTYDVSTKRLVIDMLNGFNATAIVYGQTGSGKTYSMFGKDDSAIFGSNQEGKGIIPRACEEILTAMKQRKEVNNIDSILTVAYVEIYGDQVSDLLKYGARCGQSKVASQRFVLNGAAEKVVESMEEIYQLLQIGEQQKRRAATAMNDRSTRAHSLFILTLKQSKPDTSITLQSRLFLADLGGSEQVKKSQVEAGVLRMGLNEQFSLGFEMATHMREAVYINLGLLALKRCIEALNNRASYVPFQDSKLTMLLSEGIGGNSKTSVIVCANMDPVQSTETIASLRFGERCALIETSARNNATVLAGILADLDDKIAKLEQEISVKERWEVREVNREDLFAEEGTIEKALGGKEIRTISMVVGAEEERKQLAALLLQRAQFTGSMTDDEVNAIDDNTTGKKGKKVIGFGKQYAEIYGFGGKFDETAEEKEENARFHAAANVEDLPMAVRMKKGAKSWATGDKMEETAEQLEKRAKKIKRTKLAYSGISA